MISIDKNRDLIIQIVFFETERFLSDKRQKPGKTNFSLYAYRGGLGGAWGAHPPPFSKKNTAHLCLVLQAPKSLLPLPRPSPFSKILDSPLAQNMGGGTGGQMSPRPRKLSENENSGFQSCEKFHFFQKVKNISNYIKYCESTS